MPKKVGIITLNRNGISDTRECLNSLLSLNYKNAVIYIVDNNSNNNEGQLLQNEFSSQGVSVIINKSNRGFAGGCNDGIERALLDGCDYILLFNNDAVATPDFLGPLVEYSENNPKSQIVGPLITYYKSNKIWFGGGKIGEWTAVFRHQFKYQEKGIVYKSKPYNVDYITGCCMMISSDLLKKMGLLNEKYFAYYEEADFCVRARELGVDCTLIPDSIISHKKSASAGNEGKNTLSQVQAYLIARNSIIFGYDNKKGLKKIIYTISNLLLFLYNFLFNIRKRVVLKAYLKGMRHGFMNIGGGI